MKKILLTLLAGALLASLSMLSGCAKDGKDGINGTNGTNASTAFQLTFTASNWNQIGTAGTAGAHLNSKLQDSHLSYSSIGQGAVLVFSSGGYAPSGGLQAWPFTYYGTNVSYDHQFNWCDGGINADIFESDHLLPANQTYNFTVVVIPGTPKTSWPVDLTDYNAVVRYFHPVKR